MITVTETALNEPILRLMSRTMKRVDFPVYMKESTED